VLRGLRWPNLATALSKKSNKRRQRARLRVFTTQEFRITDHHGKLSVMLRSPLRFAQLVRRGWVEQVSPTAGKLLRCFELISAELAPNGEPRLRALRDEIVWPVNHGCPTGRICEAIWLLSGNASFTLEDADAAVEKRQREIESETLLWGLPEWLPPRVREDWGSFGKVDYLGKAA
jgi:hypothetical protein